jgi:hypothetical protein
VLIAVSLRFILLIGLMLMGVTNSPFSWDVLRGGVGLQPARTISGGAGGVVGTILSSRLAGPVSGIAVSLGMDELAGAYLTTLALFVVASLVVFLGLRPDPRELGREVAKLYPESIPHGGVPYADPAPARRDHGCDSMALGQVVMVAIMVITSLHMEDHQHSRSDIYSVISAHTFGMFAPSIISGWLLDKWGRGKMILFGAFTLLLACIAAPLSPDVLPLGIALFLLGLGWNFCFVGGSTLFPDQPR